MSTYATTKLVHDPAAARERGKQDEMLGMSTVDQLPCFCEKCRAQYHLGRLDAIAEEVERRR